MSTVRARSVSVTVTLEAPGGVWLAPRGDAWGRALAHWRTLPSDEGARFDREVRLDGAEIAP